MKYVILIAILIIFVAIFLYYENHTLDITRYQLRSKAIDGRVKIAHLSDLHSMPFHKITETLRSLKPDVIMITGDYINDRGKSRGKMLAFAKELTTVAPVYYITGNHERRLEDFDVLMQELKEAGFHVLLDDVATLQIHRNHLAILGLDENQANFEDYKARKNGTFEYKDVRPCFEALNQQEGYKIVLSHFPENFEGIKDLNYAQYDFDLQLSGHAHGGQFILPGFGPVYSPGQGFRPKYARGAFGERPKLIVSRGIGNAEFPFRLFNHPEINIITVSRAADNEHLI